MITRVYSNPCVQTIVAVISVALFAMLVSDGDHDGLKKAAFIYGTSFAGGLLTLGLSFAGQATLEVVRYRSIEFTRLEVNTLVAFVGSLLTLASLVVFLDASSFKDMVAEGIASGTAGGALGIMSTFAKKDSGVQVGD